MVVPVDDNENDLHLQLRDKFFENLNTNGNYDEFEDIDLERLRNEDHYCKRFILHKKGNFEAALEMAVEALKWRKSFGVKDITQASIPIEFFQAKAVFPYNKDKEDNPIIMILIRYHKKTPEFAEALRKFVIYWVELMEEQAKGGQMTVIMSCTGAGLSNLDLDLIKFLITLFRSYYPHSLAHILIFEMPWILNPAWKIIKAWLPEDFVDKIEFVNTKTLQDYVSADNLPVDMGGTNMTEYEPPTSHDISSNDIETEVKRVHFSESGKENISNGHAGTKGKGSVVITDDYTVIGNMLKISPATQLLFPQVGKSSNDVIIKLTNVAEKCVSYKVKTNNIESYRVKPSLGIIEPESTLEINVILLSGFRPQPSDKFLIMAMEVSDSNLSTSQLNSKWKNSSPESIADHKLKCVSKEDKAAEVEEVDVGKSLKNLNALLSNLDLKVQVLQDRQASMQLRQLISMILIACLFLIVVCNTFFPDISLSSITSKFS